MLIDQGQATHVEYDGLFDSYKFPWNLLTMSDLLLKQKIDGQRISPSAKISERAVIGDNVMIEDNMVEGYRTGSNSVLMPGTKIGPNNIVGSGVTLLKSCYQTRLHFFITAHREGSAKLAYCVK